MVAFWSPDARRNKRKKSEETSVSSIIIGTLWKYVFLVNEFNLALKTLFNSPMVTIIQDVTVIIWVDTARCSGSRCIYILLSVFYAWSLVSNITVRIRGQHLSWIIFYFILFWYVAQICFCNVRVTFVTDSVNSKKSHQVRDSSFSSHFYVSQQLWNDLLILNITAKLYLLSLANPCRSCKTWTTILE